MKIIFKTMVDKLEKICEGMNIDKKVIITFQPEEITGAAGYSNQLDEDTWVIGLNAKMPQTRVEETVLMEMANIIKCETKEEGHMYDEEWQRIYEDLKEKYNNEKGE